MSVTPKKVTLGQKMLLSFALIYSNSCATLNPFARRIDYLSLSVFTQGTLNKDTKKDPRVRVLWYAFRSCLHSWLCMLQLTALC